MQLSDPLDRHFRLQKTQRAALTRMRIHSVRDLLYHFPSRYENISLIKRIVDIKKGDETILYGRINNLKTTRSFKRGTPISEARLTDPTGSLTVRWFHQPYIAKMLGEGALVKLAGTVTGEEGKLYLANPEVEHAKDLPIDAHDTLFQNTEDSFYAIYPERRGITSKWFRHAIARALAALGDTPDPIPEEILKRYHLPTLKTSLIWLHTPKRERDALSAHKRFAFEEVLYIQLARAREQYKRQQNDSFSITADKSAVRQFMEERFPFSPTRSQKSAIESILNDLYTKEAMARLLEGDVGSGKTAVAAATMYAVVATPPPENSYAHLQVAYMAPTEILARQQFEAFIEYFSHLPIGIALITSSGCKKFPSKLSPTEATDISRSQLLKWVASGEISIVVGTHALIQKKVTFKNLAYTIIDEQHRFGTLQRQTLTRKDAIVPHLLSMTATPIPRTLALTMYGDLDLTVIDEMPKGRKPILTEIVPPTKREATYKKVHEELARGRQVYVICPRIAEPDPEKETALLAKSVTEEAARLKRKVFPNYRIGIAHSKLNPKEKAAVMSRFAEHKIDILVATSVVEVGVNVLNATVIVIEGAERYGLAQLHQLRGRVIRSNEQAYCYCFSESGSKKTRERLSALKEAKSGFELAEADLTLRGAGELSGARQSGLSDIGMEALKNLKMVEAARAEARALVQIDPTLKRYPALKAQSEATEKKLHFE